MSYVCLCQIRLLEIVHRMIAIVSDIVILEANNRGAKS